MRIRVLTFLLVLALTGIPSQAQIFSMGNDPGNVRWYQMTTENYRIVYPAGMDSLAGVYARRLEKYRNSVGATIGYKPNQAYRKPMPVIIHPFTANSNGVVTWAPRRMDLLTVPAASHPIPLPAEDHLVIHESRHVAQMQPGAGKPYRWLNILTGELWPGMMAGIYPGQAFLEGDAVIAETELTKSGRGRTSTFLGYYDICFAEGDYRDFWRWRYGSQRLYTPDHYRAGYFTLAGIRTLYDDPLFSERYFRNIVTGWPFPIMNFQRTVREASGKNLKETFAEIAEHQRGIWEGEAALREPFMPSEKVTSPYRMYTAFSNLTVAGDGFLAVRSGIDRAPELVRVTAEGDVKKISPFSSSASNLSYCDSLKRLFWCEQIRDTRWEMKSSSEIRYMDQDHHIHTLAGNGRKYYNPEVGGTLVAVAEYPDEGGAAVVILDARDGSLLSRTIAPDGMQPVQFCWLDGNLYFTAITGDGFGIYDSGFRPVLEPGFTSLSNPFAKDGELYFTADRNGSEELYSLNLSECSVRRITSSRFGASFYRFLGDRLYYVSGARDDCSISSTALSDLNPTAVVFHDVRQAPVAEELSTQANLVHTEPGDSSAVRIEKYSKLAHLFRFHSWAPVYFNYDAVSHLSMETLSTSAGLGASVYFQNDLGTMQGMLGYSAWMPASGWRHSLHGKFTYSGWYPVIEASFDINGRDAVEYLPSHGYDVFKKTSKYVKTNTGLPSLNADVRIYVPLLFSSGGWKRGLIPEMDFNLSNDYFSTGSFLVPMESVKVSLRGYIMRPVPSSCIYPRFGIGAEAGYSGFIGLNGYTNSLAYGYLYGYLPGILRTHGIKWSALLQKQGEPLSRINLSYAFPFAPVDWSFLCPFAYVRNFEFTGVCSWSHLFTSLKDTLTYSAELCARLGNLLLIPYETRLGVNVSYTPGISEAPECGFVFSVSL